MKPRIPYAVAALLAAGAVSIAAAQGDNKAAGHKPNPAPAMNFTKEPIASASTTQGAEGQLAATIVDALNADPALNESKISVQPVDGQIVLSGAALTQAQKKEASQVAASKAGETKIVNTIQTDDV